MAKEFVLDVYGQWSLKIWLLTHSGCKVFPTDSHSLYR